MKISRSLTLVIISSLLHFIVALPDQGKWEFQPNETNRTVFVPKSLFKGSQIFIRLRCDPNQHELSVTVSWLLAESPCWEDYLHFGDGDQSGEANVLEEDLENLMRHRNWSYVKTSPKTYTCHGLVILDEHSNPSTQALQGEKKKGGGKRDASDKQATSQKTIESLPNESSVKEGSGLPIVPVDHPVFTVPNDGVYFLFVTIKDTKGKEFTVHIEMQGRYGYLSAADWPLLPFYGAMCLVYVIYGLAWLIVSFCQWRDLLRIQFWIGGVILLGMLEKAMFYAEYQSINSAGTSVRGAVLLAELVSCGKRTLARMLVIIVSLGFGIVKPRLGPMLHRVVGVGVLYFGLASVESYLRVMRHNNGASNQILVASVPLAVLDSAICWWIFTSLVQTTRTLRLRRNMVKLSLYRHFTNTLIFSVISSAIFMLYSIKAHRLALCLTDWKELWVDEAYWHLLFSVLLLVIMILWRPTNNNQRYAFTPLLDAPDDEDEDDQMVNDAYGVKMRSYRSSSPKARPSSSTSIEDDLKWVEDNIPSSLADTALPILDSDEEIMTTKFEISKMQ